jgi:predicted nucleic acid-binding protein
VIVVDTSVWINAFRSTTSSEAVVLRALLDADEVALAVPVRLEILGGASKSERVRLRRLLSALPVLYPTDDTWRLIDSWLDPAGAAGEQFGLGDLLIGALAHESGSLVWSLDSDFRRMARLGFANVYEP